MSDVVPPSHYTPPAPTVELPFLGKCLDDAWTRKRSRPYPPAANRRQAAVLEEQGWTHYLKGRQLKAIEAYCKAIALDREETTYYKLGNSLHNIRHYREAIQAYKLGRWGHPTPERVNYNMACAYSRLGQAAEAFRSLEIAFDQGYAATKKFKTDPDLEFLRQHPDWERHADRYFNAAAPYIGQLVEYDVRDIQDHISFCPDQRVVSHDTSSIDGSCCDSKTYGVREQKDGKFYARWHKRCGKVGIGTPGRSGEGPCELYPRCSEQVTCKEFEPTEPRLLVSKTEINKNRRPQYGPGDDGDVAFVQRGKFPRACLEDEP